MKKIMTAICAILVTAGAAAQNTDDSQKAGIKVSATKGNYLRLKAKQDTIAIMNNDEEVGTIPQGNKPLYLIKTPDGKLIPATIDTIKVEMVKSMTVFKHKEACEQFAEYGDISNGVVIVEIKGADITFTVRESEDYMRLKIKQDSLTFTLNEQTERMATLMPVSNTGTPLYLITTGDDELKSVSIDTVEQKRIESIAVFKGSSADKFAGYGDISHGVVIVKVKR